MGILETVKRTQHDQNAYSLTEFYNTVVGAFQARYHEHQTFSFSFPDGADPDTCPWPLKPDKFWTTVTAFDGQVTFFNKSVKVPGLKNAKVIKQKYKEGDLILATKEKLEDMLDLLQCFCTHHVTECDDEDIVVSD